MYNEGVFTRHLIGMKREFKASGRWLQTTWRLTLTAAYNLVAAYKLKIHTQTLTQ
jgi:hypothetical protein